jgi:hypothetical protein
MKSRCYTPSHRSYARYGGRWVQVCYEWRVDYLAFLSHVGERPSPAHSLDHYPDKDGDYKPGNVRWATAKEQASNRRRNSAQHITPERAKTIRQDNRPYAQIARDHHTTERYIGKIKRGERHG